MEMRPHPFRRAGAVATVLGLVLAVLVASRPTAPVIQTQRVHAAPLVTEYQLGDMRFTGFATVVTAAGLEVHFHESGRSLDQVMGGINRSNCNDQRCPPAASRFRLDMFDPTGKPLGQAWGYSSFAAPVLGPEPPYFDFDMTWPRGTVGRYKLVVGYLGLGEFERYVDVQ